jgi:hypothetical protein
VHYIYNSEYIFHLYPISRATNSTLVAYQTQINQVFKFFIREIKRGIMKQLFGNVQMTEEKS